MSIVGLHTNAISWSSLQIQLLPQATDNTVVCCWCFNS